MAAGSRFLSSKKEAQPRRGRTSLPSPRGNSVLQMLSEGRSVKEIGKELYRSEATVREITCAPYYRRWVCSNWKGSRQGPRDGCPRRLSSISHVYLRHVWSILSRQLGNPTHGEAARRYGMVTAEDGERPLPRSPRLAEAE